MANFFGRLKRQDSSDADTLTFTTNTAQTITGKFGYNGLRLVKMAFTRTSGTAVMAIEGRTSSTDSDWQPVAYIQWTTGGAIILPRAPGSGAISFAATGNTVLELLDGYDEYRFTPSGTWVGSLVVDSRMSAV